jgi:hypothetical protein
MFPSRAVGHLRPPTSQQVAEYADRAGLHLTPEEQELLAAMAAGTMATFDRIEELDSPAVPLRHPYRDPGHPPVAGERTRTTRSSASARCAAPRPDRSPDGRSPSRTASRWRACR